MSYLIRKLTYQFIALFLVITLTFVLMKAIPGDPFTDEKGLPPKVYEALQTHYGLDAPLWQQYLRYIGSILQGNLGPSYYYESRTVSQIIADGFPISAVLGGEALLLAFSLGTTIGCISAVHFGSRYDRSLMLLTTLGISLPSFIIAALLQYVFALKLGILPLARWGSFSQTILPVIALASGPTAYIARLVRVNMRETLQQRYIQAARARGISSWTVLIHHALRNALLPLLPYFGPLAANILVGSFVIEKIFGIPGLGQWFIASINDRNYTVIMGTTIFYSALLLTAVFLADLLYGFLDPRVRELRGETK